MTTMKNANIVDGSIDLAVLRTARTMMICAPPSQAVVDAKREVAAVTAREEIETGRMLMMTRYIALLMCDSTVVRNVFRMKVDVVYIGSFTPSNPALACR
jgi:hypothetical protein